MRRNIDSEKSSVGIWPVGDFKLARAVHRERKLYGYPDHVSENSRKKVAELCDDFKAHIKFAVAKCVLWAGIGTSLGIFGISRMNQRRDFENIQRQEPNIVLQENNGPETPSELEDLLKKGGYPDEQMQWLKRVLDSHSTDKEAQALNLMEMQSFQIWGEVFAGRPEWKAFSDCYRQNGRMIYSDNLDTMAVQKPELKYKQFQIGDYRSAEQNGVNAWLLKNNVPTYEAETRTLRLPMLKVDNGNVLVDDTMESLAIMALIDAYNHAQTGHVDYSDKRLGAAIPANLQSSLRAPALLKALNGDMSPASIVFMLHNIVKNTQGTGKSSNDMGARIYWLIRSLLASGEPGVEDVRRQLLEALKFPVMFTEPANDLNMGTYMRMGGWSEERAKRAGEVEPPEKMSKMMYWVRVLELIDTMQGESPKGSHKRQVNFIREKVGILGDSVGLMDENEEKETGEVTVQWAMKRNLPFYDRKANKLYIPQLGSDLPLPIVVMMLLALEDAEKGRDGDMEKGELKEMAKNLNEQLVNTAEEFIKKAPARSEKGVDLTTSYEILKTLGMLLMSKDSRLSVDFKRQALAGTDKLEAFLYISARMLQQSSDPRMETFKKGLKELAEHPERIDIRALYQEAAEK